MVILKAVIVREQTLQLVLTNVNACLVLDKYGSGIEHKLTDSGIST